MKWKDFYSFPGILSHFSEFFLWVFEFHNYDSNFFSREKKYKFSLEINVGSYIHLNLDYGISIFFYLKKLVLKS